MKTRHEIPAERLAQLYTDLRCDGCGHALTPDPKAIWAKIGCSYYCPRCAG